MASVQSREEGQLRDRLEGCGNTERFAVGHWRLRIGIQRDVLVEGTSKTVHVDSPQFGSRRKRGSDRSGRQGHACASLEWCQVNRHMLTFHDERRRFRNDVLREIEIMKQLADNAHVLQFLAYTVPHEGVPILLLEYCSNGNLQTFLQTRLGDAKRSHAAVSAAQRIITVNAFNFRTTIKNCVMSRT